MWCCSAVGWKFFDLLRVAVGTWQVKCCGLIIHSLNSNIDWDVWIHSMRSSKKPWLCGPLELLRVWLLHHCAKQTNQIKIWRRHVTNLEMWRNSLLCGSRQQWVCRTAILLSSNAVVHSWTATGMGYWCNAVRVLQWQWYAMLMALGEETHQADNAPWPRDIFERSSKWCDLFGAMMATLWCSVYLALNVLAKMAFSPDLKSIWVWASLLYLKSG